MQALRFLFTAVMAVAPSCVYGQSALEACADQFIGATAANAPAIGSSAPEEPFLSNRHLCYRDDGVSFFAMEYWPERFAPRWAAYRLAPENYGPDGCRTYTRGKANCYIRAESWAAFERCTEASDPFHADHMLEGGKLSPSDFSNTGHDRGHIAPRQAFSWHVCAAYQTFTMANMSPQRASLNQLIWQHLERQVLTWALDEGPLYVVTGTTYRRFPHERFDIYADGTLDENQIYPPDNRMLAVVERHALNRAGHEPGHRLWPQRNADPERVAARVRDLPLPTGYYKVVYRPAVDGEPAHAIGFLLPHSFENLNDLPNAPPQGDFWTFVSRIDLIEETSGTRFPGIPEAMKRRWGDPFFLSRKTARNIPSAQCETRSAAGVVANTTRNERIALCTDRLVPPLQ